MSKIWQATVCVEYMFECEGKNYDEAHEDAIHVVWDSDNMSSWVIHLKELKELDNGHTKRKTQ